MRTSTTKASLRAILRSLVLVQGAVFPLMIASIPRDAAGASGTWTATTSGSWTDTTNWAGGIVGTGTGFTATFAPDILTDVTVTNNAQRAIGSLVFGTAAPASGTGTWLVTGSNLVFTNGGTSAPATISVNSLGSVTISSIIYSSTANNSLLAKSGTGKLILTTSNAISSDVSITAGTLEISNDNQLGAAPGSFDANRLGISNGAMLRTSSTLTLAQNRGITIGSGGGTLSINGGGLTYAGRLSGTGQAVKVTGSSALTISNATGVATDVNWDLSSNNGVRTFFQGSNAIGTGSVRVRNGVRLTSQNTAPTSGQVTNAVTVDSGGGLTARSSAGAVTYTNVTLPTSGTVVLNKDDQTTSGLTILSAATLTGNLTVDTTQGGTNAVGRVTLSGVFSGSGGLIKSGTGTSGVLVLGGSNTYSGTTSVTTGDLYVNGDQSLATGPVIVSASASLGGSGTVGGLVSLASTATLKPGSLSVGTLTLSGSLSFGSGINYNWQMMSGTGVAGAADAWDLLALSGTLSINASSANPFKINLATITGTAGTSGSAANFNPATSGSWTIARAAGGITGFAADKFLITSSATNATGGFINDLAGGTFSLAQSGNDLNLVFTAGTPVPPTVITINVASGTQTQAQAGYALLSGSIPVLKTGSGTLVVNAANTLSGSTTVAGGRLQLADGGALATSRIVPISGGTVTLSPALQTTVGGLDPNVGGLVDVGNGSMTVAAGLSEAGMLTALLTGRGDGSWNGTAGITSSQAQADIAVSVPRTVGWLNNGDGSMTFAFAAAGDTNLDWTVDILDAANFLAGGKFDSGQPASWLEGDFGYDGFVDILDAADFLSTGLFDAGVYNPTASGSIAAVPEPSAWAMATALGCVVALHRLRCRRTKEQASP
ncbi:MAG: autotransporter-associated beta strand repeat-containing protein [Planctomycetes bacterium]|nr:autotransporter-associated beta strand repeat-containing protein [Planctomycetota bacterium]